MAHDQEGPKLPLVAASAIAQYVPVQFLQGGSALSEKVIANGSYNIFPVGFTEATIAAGQEVGVLVGGVSKGIAGASLGAGAPVAVGSTNGVLIPLLGSGLSTALGSAIGAGGLRWQVGIALKNAAAGDYFPVWVKPDQII